HHDYDQCFQSVQLLQWNSQVKFNVTVYRNLDRKSGSAGMPRPISYAVFCLKKKIVRVRYLDADGNPHTKMRDELDFHYRHVPDLTKNYAVSAVFRGKPAPAEEIAKRLEESQQKRRTSQPIAKSAGCIFKNPDSVPAGKLVDELGLKNSSVGKARVSEVHGNFIVNDGGATASEMLELIDRIKEAARTKRGIELETEVQIVGESDAGLAG